MNMFFCFFFRFTFAVETLDFQDLLLSLEENGKNKNVYLSILILVVYFFDCCFFFLSLYEATQFSCTLHFKPNNILYYL